MIIRDAVASDAAAIAKVRTQTWQSAYRGIISDEYLDNMSEIGFEEKIRNVLSSQNSGEIHKVAQMENGDTVGWVAGGRERGGNPDYDGEIYALYVLPEYQNNGIGRDLVKYTACDLKKCKMKSILIWMLDGNSARGFYEHLGGMEVSSKSVEIAGAVLKEVAFGWLNIEMLIGCSC